MCNPKSLVKNIKLMMLQEKRKSKHTMKIFRPIFVNSSSHLLYIFSDVEQENQSSHSEGPSWKSQMDEYLK